MTKQLDIINLPYPMFPVTEEEKVLLRKAELAFTNKNCDYCGLCGVLGNLPGVSRYVVFELKDKIKSGLGRMTPMLTDESRIRQALKDSWPLSFEEKQFLRRVWITKLLNQDVSV